MLNLKQNIWKMDIIGLGAIGKTELGSDCTKNCICGILLRGANVLQLNQFKAILRQIWPVYRGLL